MNRILLALGTLILAIAPAIAGDCVSVSDVTTQLAAANVPYTIIAGPDAVVAFGAMLGKNGGQPVPPGTTRILTVPNGHDVKYGFEVKGCVVGPYTLSGVGA